MPAFFLAKASEFVRIPQAQIVGELSRLIIQGFSGDHSRQLASWETQIKYLQQTFEGILSEYPSSGQWGVLLEYSLLRLQRRLDVVILAGKSVLVIEFKVGATTYQASDIRQVEDYALDLRDFHEESHHLIILPILCATNAETRPLFSFNGEGVAETNLCNFESLKDFLRGLASNENSHQISLDIWNKSPYRPVPSIIEAAELLYAGHTVRDVAHASTDPKNLGVTTDRLIQIIEEAHKKKKHIVAFVTGVPGSGKTLVGLNSIHDNRFRQDGRESGAFLSGNTPLVTVLREALARDEHARTGKKLETARREVRSEIQNLMAYLEEYLVAHPNSPPVDHVIVFDEAQRAWDADYGAMKFNRAKSESALFLEIMGRHHDWAVIVALVGGGQEINRGERGITEWGAALEEWNKQENDLKWDVYAAPEVLFGGTATSWQSLFNGDSLPSWVTQDVSLHLPVSVRSYKCLATSKWVNHLLSGEIQKAKEVILETENFPMFLTRSLDTARSWLKAQSRGTRRCGLIASSGARRLRAEGLGTSLSADELSDVANWYLLPKGDIRSSFALEVAANEYTCQGLELDYVGMCWDTDLFWDENAQVWNHRRLRGSRWQVVQKEDMKSWMTNKYRVLLTRARLGTIIWVPIGDASDETRNPEDLNFIAEVLMRAGLKLI